jgi:hypothetical protein
VSKKEKYVTATVNSPSPSITSNRTFKYAQSAALLLTAGVLFRSGMVASLSNLFSFHPNSIAAVWGNLDTIVALLPVPTSFAVLTSLRPATLTAIVLVTLAFSVYAAQTLLVLVDKISDQTFLLLNSYLKEVNPVLPLTISFVALTFSILRLKTYQIS